MFHHVVQWIVGRASRRPTADSPAHRTARPAWQPRCERLEDRTLPDAGLAQVLLLPQDEFVDGVYTALLNRAPSLQEAERLTQQLTGGQSRTDAVATVLASGTYVRAHSGGWLSNLYDDVLGRIPDARGLASWKAARSDRLSRLDIARGFLFGQEFQGRVSVATAEAADPNGVGATAAMPNSPAGLLVHVRAGIGNGLLRLTRRAESLGASVEPTNVPRLFRINGDETSLNGVAQGLQDRAFVDYIEHEMTYQVDLAPNDPSYAASTLWGLNGTYGAAAPAAWNTATGSTKVVVAVIDTGVDYNHPDLYKNIWVNQAEIPATWLTRTSASSGYNRTVDRSRVVDSDGDGKLTFWDLNDPANSGLVWDNNGDGRIDASDLLLPRNLGGWENGVDNGGDGYIDNLVGWNFVANNNRPFDDNKHGTHVAGTIGAMGDNGVGVVGVNWKTQIMALKFLDANGHGSNASAASALRLSANDGAVVSNNSWGGGSSDSTLRDAITYAGSRGQIVVAAAGNEGRNISVTPSYPAAYHLPNMIVVAATDSSGNLATFSNRSSTLVDIGAPGVSIYSTLPGGNYGNLSGTSMATPHVTGVVALLEAARPNLTVSQAIGRVISQTTTLGSLAGNTVTGGLLNAARAIGSSGAPAAPATPDTPTWNRVSSADGFISWNAVSGATSYVIEYSVFADSWTQYGIVSGTSELVPTWYYYRVAATNSSGMSSFSSAVYASAQNPDQPPASPGQPTWSSAGGSTINLSWNAVSGATGYEVQWWNSSTSSWVDIGTYNGTSAQFNYGLGFYWRLRAVNAYGASDYSPFILAGQWPDKPTWSFAGGSDIDLYWNNIGATSYAVQYWSSTSGNWVTMGTYSNVTSLRILYGFGYYWRVGAIYSYSTPLYSDYVLAR